ncbi:hypothetical protein FB381_3359 [Nocardioides albertanoniae]|uniref:Uncharacterized protein n=1 Tax=Nocardioides albertanoniae TaxID=1175486 RepID=A0A543AA18_9ACTN|nr:hypothetical protein FB381_3359 [Nocardioides albertanoniae]
MLAFEFSQYAGRSDSSSADDEDRCRETAAAHALVEQRQQVVNLCAGEHMSTLSTHAVARSRSGT